MKKTGSLHRSVEVAFSPDGKLVAIAESKLEVLELGTWAPIRTIAVANLVHPRFDKEGKRLGYFQGSIDFIPYSPAEYREGTVFIMDLATGELQLQESGTDHWRQ